MSNIPNPVDAIVEDAPVANPEPAEAVTVPEPTEDKPIEPEIDYKEKFSHSSREAQRILEEKKALEAELEALRKEREAASNEVLFPGFEELDEPQKQNLLAYTNTIRESVKKEIYQDPSIAFARQSFNERKWDTAFDKVASEFPQLKDDKDFKAKYFRADNVPTNIEAILRDTAKIHLFDKAAQIGAEEERKKADRIDLERAKGGPKTPTTSRSLEDWQRIAQENPAKFAKLSKEYAADLESGKLK